MPDTGKERRWPKEIVVCLECGEGIGCDGQMRIENLQGCDANGGQGHGPTQIVSVMPVSEHEAALAQARKEGREEAREALFSELEAAGWSSGEEIPVDEVEAAFARVLERAALDSTEQKGAQDAGH